MPRKRLFPPRPSEGDTLRNKGRQVVRHDTVNGSIPIRRTRWWSAARGTDSAMDQMLGIVNATVSVGVRQMCCRVGIHQQGFVKAAEHLKALAQLRLSPERVRRLAQTEGRQVQALQAAGQVPSDLSVETARIKAGGPSRVYVGADGVKVPMITQQEKAQRRQRRRRRKSGSTGPVRRMHRGADNAYKEFKLATLYEESNTHRLVVGTAGDHQVLGTRGLERKRHRVGSRGRQALDGLLQYLTKRASQCEYPRYLAAGYQIGSGPTEAMCKVLTYRLKGPGMRWDKEGAEPMMALLALEQSNAWDSYWQTQYRAAQPCQKT